MEAGRRMSRKLLVSGAVSLGAAHQRRGGAPSCRCRGSSSPPMASCRSGGGRAGRRLSFRSLPTARRPGRRRRRGAPTAILPDRGLRGARASATTVRLAVGGVAMPTVLPATARRIVVIGDTGCRIEGKAVQDCGNPDCLAVCRDRCARAAKQPELVIHLGDFYYREAALPGRARWPRRQPVR